VSGRMIVAKTSRSFLGIVLFFTATNSSIHCTTAQHSWGKWSRARNIDTNDENTSSLLTLGAYGTNKLHSRAGAELKKREVVIFTMTLWSEVTKAEGSGPTLRRKKMSVKNSGIHESRVTQDCLVEICEKARDAHEKVGRVHKQRTDNQLPTGCFYEKCQTMAAVDRWVSDDGEFLNRSIRYAEKVGMKQNITTSLPINKT
jgi:hypothetical protein